MKIREVPVEDRMRLVEDIRDSITWWKSKSGCWANSVRTGAFQNARRCSVKSRTGNGGGLP